MERVEPKITALFIQEKKDDWKNFNFKQFIDQGIDQVLVVIKSDSIIECYRHLDSITKGSKSKFRIINVLEENIDRYLYAKYIENPYVLYTKDLVPTNFLLDFNDSIMKQMKKTVLYSQNGCKVFSSIFLKFYDLEKIEEAVLEMDKTGEYCVVL